MDIRKLKVAVSEQYSDDLKNIFQYGLETFGYTGALLFYDNIEKLVFEQIPNMDNPFLYKDLKSMQGYHGFYKIRAGNYRIGIYINQKSKRFEFCRILLRKDIYRYFP